MKHPRRIRRRLLIRPLQFRQLLFELMYGFAFVVIFFVTFFLPLMIKLQDTTISELERQQVADQFLELHYRGWPAIGLLIFLYVLHSIIVSHRIAGPLYRFKKIFRAVGDGDLTVPVGVRSKDYLQTEADALRAMVGRLRKRIDAMKEDNDDAARLCSDIRFTMPKNASDELRQYVKQLEERVLSLRARLDDIRTSDDPPRRPHVVEPERDPSVRGFTLIEMVLVVAIFGILAVVGLPNYSRALEAARVARAIGDIRTIEKDISTYEVENKVPPATLALIGRDALLDPWKRQYVYLNFVASGATVGQMRKDRFLVPLNTTYDLYSKGHDGASKPPLNAPPSHDDVVRANDGGFVGLAENF